MFLIPSTGFSLFQATILLILNTRFFIYKQRFSYFKEFWARGFWFQAWQILIPTQGFFISKNFEHRVFEFQAWHYMFQAQSFFLFQAKKGFLISRILSTRFLHSKQRVFYFKNFEQRVL
jgi:hypothetical protein